MTEQPFQVAPFEQIRSYDKPTALMGMALDGELSTRGVRDLMFRPEGLTLAERDGIVERMKARMGNNAVGDTLVDLATNPFVWFVALTGPAAGAALKGTGRIFQVNKAVSAFAIENGSILNHLMTSNNLFHATPLPAVVRALNQKIAHNRVARSHLEDDVVKKTLERTGLKSLDPASSEEAKRLNVLIGAWLKGADVDNAEVFSKLRVVKGKHGRIEDLVLDQTTPVKKAWTHKDLTKELKDVGGYELAQFYRGEMNRQFSDLIGKGGRVAYDKTGKIIIDDEKVMRLARGLTNYKHFGKGGDATADQVGAMAVAKLMSPEVADAVVKGNIGADRLQRVMGELFEGAVQQINAGGRSFYMPRNYTTAIRADGKPMTGGSARRVFEQRQSRALVATHQAKPRRAGEPLWDPEYMNDFENYVGGVTDEFDQVVRRQSAMRRDVADRYTPSTEMAAHRVDPSVQMPRYFNDTDQSIALYSQKIDDYATARQSWEETKGFMDKDMLGRIEHNRAQLIKEGKHGGDSMADLLAWTYDGIPDSSSFRKDFMRQTLIPRVMGTTNYKHDAIKGAFLTAQRSLGAFIDSGVGEALGAQGHGRMAQALRQLADTSRPIGFGATALAKHLYVTHLGLNISSAMLNVTQPWLLAAPMLGAGPVARGYAKAMGETMDFYKERQRILAGTGRRFMTEVERDEAIRKAFKYSDVDGEDLIGIRESVFESLDETTMDRLASAAGNLSTQDKMNRFMMTLFERAEHVNRSTVAHAVEHAYRGAGLNLADDAVRLKFRDDLRLMVQETQFGGQMLNMPAVFLKDNMFGNPLIRQFLQFPLRSVTAFPSISGTLRGVPRGMSKAYWGAVGHDMLRAMGTSAVIYEVSKNLFGVDPSRALFVSSQTDLFGGQRFLDDGNEWIPIPPVLDIPIQLARGAMAGDIELLGRNLPRLVPGGVALSRTFGIAPDNPIPDFMGQRTYADWSQRNEEGGVPVFKRTGELNGFQHAPTLILRGLGVNTTQWENESALTHYLTTQREVTVDYRRRALAALLSNNINKAQSIRREYERRTGLPLTISEEQMRRAMESRQVSRPERTLNRMPKDARPFYRQLLANDASLTGVSAEALMQAETIKARQQLAQTNAYPMTSEEAQELRRRFDQIQKEESLGRDQAPVFGTGGA
jgi:hypothetical protein